MQHKKKTYQVFFKINVVQLFVFCHFKFLKLVCERSLLAVQINVSASAEMEAEGSRRGDTGGERR